MKPKYRIKKLTYKNRVDYIPQYKELKGSLVAIIIFKPIMLFVSLILFFGIPYGNGDFKESLFYYYNKWLFTRYKFWHEIENYPNKMFELSGYSLFRAEYLVQWKKEKDKAELKQLEEKELKKQLEKQANKLRSKEYIY